MFMDIAYAPTTNDSWISTAEDSNFIAKLCALFSFVDTIWKSIFNLVLLTLAWGDLSKGQTLSDCPGYYASNVSISDSIVTADLSLNGSPCNIYGKDLTDLKLRVEYQTETRLHVQIYDAAQQVYQVPASVVNRPNSTTSSGAGASDLVFILVQKPFSFAIQRQSNNEVIFNTSSTALIFESQYLRLRTSLPGNPNLYGLGEDTDAFRLNTTNYTRTLWSRDAYLVPSGSNLYGNHPIYFDNRAISGTHGVFFLNSNGMDIKINNTSKTGQYLEYNTIGGIFDLYFLSGPSPKEVAQQYSKIIGTPALQAYWSFGFHQCRYGMQDVYEVADVVFNYSAAGIPLETMWTDIDYMNFREVLSLDPERFSLHKMRELVQHLHNHNQRYVLMVDPAVAYQNYSAFNNGKKAGAFMMNQTGGVYQGVVWPGITAFPDWFAPNTQSYWNNEFENFFSPETGVDIDGLWIDMNEASNFCSYPCSSPAAFAKQNGNPPIPPPVRGSNPMALPGWPADFQPVKGSTKRSVAATTGNMMGLPGRDLINPPYQIRNDAGSISNKTIDTNLIHHNGLTEYDTHNLYGTMMSSASRDAMLNRRPGERPLIITRSTFAGAGTKVGHWLGDNSATWDNYRISIAGSIAFAAIYQLPMVGADVCGFAGNTTQMLCARWAMLGAFTPFYRSHQSDDTINHEFYRWPLVAKAAKIAIKARYQLLDYLYTAFYQQNIDGTPSLNPMFFIYPLDSNTFGIDTQWFYGSDILVSPVMNENGTDVTFYLPSDQFYDFWTFEPIRGKGANIHLTGVSFTEIPVHIRGGAVIPMRVDGANTTTALRKLNFNLIVAPGLDGTASGMLYLDDGISLTQDSTSVINFTYTDSSLNATGTFDYDSGVQIEYVILLGLTTAPKDGKYSTTAKTATFTVNQNLTGPFSITLS